MASIWEALKTVLTSDSTVASKVVSGGTTRIHLSRAPDKPTFPCIVLEELGNRLEQSRDGSSKLRYMDLILNIYVQENDLLASGELLRKVITALLTGKQGTSAGVDIQGILFNDDSVDWLDADQVWAIEQSFLVMYIQPD